jgi:hypothetical protein
VRCSPRPWGWGTRTRARGPPFRLSYKGLGKPICFTAFGPLAVGAFYLALAAGTGGSVWMGLPPAPSLAQTGVMGAAAPVGLTTTAILFSSHFHQEDGDREVGLALRLLTTGAAPPLAATAGRGVTADTRRRLGRPRRGRSSRCHVILIHASFSQNPRAPLG